MSDPTEQPAPVVSERHREVAKEIIGEWDSIMRYPCLNDRESEADEAAATVLARAFPLQVPTTDRPTQPGVFWYRNRPEEHWELVHVKRLMNALCAYTDGCSLAWVDDMTGEWLRIPTPDELAGKEQA
ncbi:hypothetical protein TSACC_21693 [Terrimicrobium sacchariphilum]|uniref:Uncharacterized protein n=1 Tax=Terrimicrobium sacchariphilum TaxID=690879 RepID=A0A146G6T3_TERSA|nr:hypothetical protein [Terrimicrobium sacchariphilum]GAT33280.1 hypothetical protein TSACC_21693 [Terrimicrobium sacchariphilum]